MKPNCKEGPAMALTVDALDHIVINVRDVEAAAAWYQRVLGMTREDFDTGPGKVRRTSMKFANRRSTCGPCRPARRNGSPPITRRPAATIYAS
jgi:catechol 2,3-dioxygenase-like lactoylglutathione lyase family enzyme